jgi:hypothetical protein
MGRKKTVQKTSKYDTNIENDDFEDEEIDETVEDEKWENLKLETAFKIQRAILEYCDNIALPMCEYLNIQTITDYLNELS